MNRLLRFFVALALALCLWPAMKAAAALLVAPNTNFITVDREKSTISTALGKAAITDVAETLAQQAGIKVFLEKSLTETITAKFENMPMELGIKRLFGPISTSLVFAEEKDRQGKEFFRLETVKIFPKGKMLSPQTVEYKGGRPVAGHQGAAVAVGGEEVFQLKTSGRPATVEESGPVEVTMPKGGMSGRKTPGSMRQAIAEAQANLDRIRRKGQAEADRLNMDMARIKRELSQNPSPKKRAELTPELTFLEKDMIRQKNLQSRIEIEEQKNIRESTQQLLKSGGRPQPSEGQLKQMESDLALQKALAARHKNDKKK